MIGKVHPPVLGRLVISVRTCLLDFVAVRGMVCATRSHFSTKKCGLLFANVSSCSVRCEWLLGHFATVLGETQPPQVLLVCVVRADSFSLDWSS